MCSTAWRPLADAFTRKRIRPRSARFPRANGATPAPPEAPAKRSFSERAQPGRRGVNRAGFADLVCLQSAAVYDACPQRTAHPRDKEAAMRSTLRSRHRPATRAIARSQSRFGRPPRRPVHASVLAAAALLLALGLLPAAGALAEYPD